MQIYQELAFDQHMQSVLNDMPDKGTYDLIIGIPFIDEKEELTQLLKKLDKQLLNWNGRRHLIVCAGDYTSENSLKVIKEVPLANGCLAFLMPKEASGRGMSIRAFLEIARQREADLLILNADMVGKNGASPEINYLESLLTPVQGQYDMVLGSLRSSSDNDSISQFFAAPLLEVFYGSRLGDPLAGIYAISHEFVEELNSEGKFWTQSIGGFGIDFWLITRALIWDKKLSEFYLQGRINRPNLEKRNHIFREIALSAWECISRDSSICLQERVVIKVPDVIVRSRDEKADIISYSEEELRKKYYETFLRCGDYLQTSLSPRVFSELQALNDPGAEFIIGNDLWTELCFALLINYAFGVDEEKECILDSLTAVYNARLATFLQEIATFNHKIASWGEVERKSLLLSKLEAIRHSVTEQFWRQKSLLTEKWVDKVEQTRTPLVPLHYMEYVPGRPIVIPKKLTGKDNHEVETDALYKRLRHKYEEKLKSFLAGLNLSLNNSSSELLGEVKKFMAKVENSLAELLPGDIYTPRGLQLFIDKLMNLVPHKPMFTIRADLLREMIMRFPPVNLMIPQGYYTPAQLIENMDVRDAVTYANLIEEWSYTDRDLAWLVEHLKPESFEWVDIKALILENDLRYGSLTHTKISNLNRITARIAVKPLDKGRGGQYPRLRYCLEIVRRLTLAEHYSQLFSFIVSERKSIGLKVRHALLNIQKGDDFSAYNIFENYHHRGMVEKIQALALTLEADGQNEMAGLFKQIVDGYGVSQVLADGSFLTGTAWSWASYSFKGGRQYPGPFTTSVEARWFNHDLIEELYRELGYNVEEIMQTVFRLIHTGKSGFSLLDAALPARPRDVAVVIQEATDEPSKTLQRFAGNPLLETIAHHDWENKYVLNPGALRIKDKVYLFYRAVGQDDVSRIGLAITDGYNVIERLDKPIFSPAIPEEKMGCEDPRLIVIDDKIWMLYTAYDGNIAQIAAASIFVEDFLNGNYNWQREGLAFKNIWDKDAILFPEKVNGKYILYHRIEPSMWVTYLDEIAFPCWEKHAIILGPRPGHMWDSLKIGAGAQPIKTIYGWLLIYHGVDHNYVYRLGVILVDLNNPQKILYRSPNPILEPVADYEIGLTGAWVPNVVFTCGAVPGSDKPVLEDEDEILVYYGAADTSIGMAQAKLIDLIPQKFRKRG